MTETRARTPVPPPLENGDSVDLDRAYAPIEEVEDWKANYNKATDACVALRTENDRLKTDMINMRDQAFEQTASLRAENERLKAETFEIILWKQIAEDAMADHRDEVAEDDATIATLRAENERLVEEVERLRACLHDYENIYPQAKDSLRAENERLRLFINNAAMMFEHLGFKTQAHECRAALQSKQGE